jgi:tellurite resistance protein TehA-like permease
VAGDRELRPVPGRPGRVRLGRGHARPALLGGGPGDQWIGGGALAIASLACAEPTDAAGALASLGWLRPPLGDAALGLWVATAAWLPVLAVDELRSPRLRYDVRRWSTVFPPGMYAVSSAAVGRAMSVSLLVSFARVWIWIALAVWLAVAIAGVQRARTLAVSR